MRHSSRWYSRRAVVDLPTPGAPLIRIRWGCIQVPSSSGLSSQVVQKLHNLSRELLVGDPRLVQAPNQAKL